MNWWKSVDRKQSKSSEISERETGKHKYENGEVCYTKMYF